MDETRSNKSSYFILIVVVWTEVNDSLPFQDVFSHFCFNGLRGILKLCLPRRVQRPVRDKVLLRLFPF